MGELLKRIQEAEKAIPESKPEQDTGAEDAARATLIPRMVSILGVKAESIKFGFSEEFNSFIATTDGFTFRLGGGDIPLEFLAGLSFYPMMTFDDFLNSVSSTPQKTSTPVTGQKTSVPASI